ncbi:YqzL-like protein, partial [Dysosmobacter welbionis]
WTSAPQSWNFFSTGYAMAQPTPPPTTQTFFLPSVSVA